MQGANHLGRNSEGAKCSVTIRIVLWNFSRLRLKVLHTVTVGMAIQRSWRKILKILYISHSVVTDSEFASESTNFFTVCPNPNTQTFQHPSHECTSHVSTAMEIINAMTVIVRHTWSLAASPPTTSVIPRWLKGKPCNLGASSTMLSQCTVPLSQSTSVSFERPFRTAVLVTSMAGIYGRRRPRQVQNDRRETVC